MKGHGEAVSFVAHYLNQMQHRRKLVEHDRLVFLPVDVDPFFALGDRGQRLIGNSQRFQRLRGGVQLAQAAVDQNQSRPRQLFFLAACRSAA